MIYTLIKWYQFHGKISISVVCPTYNSEKYIKRTLEMLLKQKLQMKLYFVMMVLMIIH